MEDVSPTSLQFHFQLKPIEDVLPWGDSPSRLHWFGLTAGWFWIEVGGQELFRYSDALLKHWAQQYPQFASSLPYEEYQIARYWEDLLAMLSAILDPIPADIASKVAAPFRSMEWENHVARWMEQAGDAVAWDLLEPAARWWWERKWDAGHLSNPPNIWLWTVGATTHIRWDNRSIRVDDIPVWAADFGELSLAASEFREAVRTFHKHFIAAMEDRVIIARQAWPRPEIHINLPQLENEQSVRATHLYRVLSSTARTFAWEDVRLAIAQMEAQ